MKCFRIALALLIVTLACRGSEKVQPHDNTAMDDARVSADVPARVLSSGPGMMGNRLPDCAHFDSGNGEGALPGVNCVQWGLDAWAAAYARSASSIVVAQVERSIEKYYEIDAIGDVEKCEVLMGPEFATNTIEVSLIPVSYRVLEVWKGDPETPPTGYLRGKCYSDKKGLCRVNAPLGDWYIQPGENLILLAEDCCISQSRPGGMKVVAIYPVDGRNVYDYDGSVFEVETVKKWMNLTVASTDIPYWASPCSEGYGEDLPKLDANDGADTSEDE